MSHSYWQLPVEQPVACMWAGGPTVQSFPHAPQLAMSFAESFSHPSVSEVLQSRHAPMHESIWHAPAPSHDPFAFGYFVVQLLPHVPQSVCVVFRFTSHPFSGMLLSQSSKFARQLYWHAPSEQPATTVLSGGLTLQSVAQSPQCAGSVLRFASHPFAAPPSQSVHPLSQVYPQVPLVHVGAALAGSPHVVVQLPHALMLLSVGVSHPSDVSLLQSPQPLLQLPIWHAPATHDPGACANVVVQLLPHTLQFVSLSSAASQPSDVSLLQSAHPLSHEPISHPAAPQYAVAWFNAEFHSAVQSFPHALQFCASKSGLLSQPSTRSVLQSS